MMTKPRHASDPTSPAIGPSALLRATGLCRSNSLKPCTEIPLKFKSPAATARHRPSGGEHRQQTLRHRLGHRATLRPRHQTVNAPTKLTSSGSEGRYDEAQRVERAAAGVRRLRSVSVAVTRCGWLTVG